MTSSLIISLIVTLQFHVVEICLDLMSILPWIVLLLLSFQTIWLVGAAVLLYTKTNERNNFYPMLQRDFSVL